MLITRLWFVVRTLAARGRFLTGKASYVKSHVDQTTSALAEVYDRQGRSLGSRLLAHHRLATEPPRTGTQGWELLAAHAGPSASGQALVRLECGFCGHLFFIEIGKPGPAEAPPRGASYAASWFSFMGRDYEGEPALSCPHCEQSSVPGVRYGAEKP
ncbi:MAG: hypothetical protein HY926_15325 [Elusimicrobia bacterium]|nr:hypothetical protein [Elusimicrobiota bacterium]